jgi:hypothetical protein
LVWGLKGQVIDNSKEFLGGVPSRELYTEDGTVEWPSEFTMSLEAANEDGVVIVAAEATVELGTSIEHWNHDAEDVEADILIQDNEETAAFDYIEFPNVVPGMVGIKLLSSGALGTDVTEVESETESPQVEILVTPIDGLEAKIGLVWDTETLQALYYTSGVSAAALGAVLFTDDPRDIDADALQSALSVFEDPDNASWDIALYDTFGISLQAEYTLAISEEDSVTVTAGTIFDTSYTNHAYIGTEQLDDVDNPSVIYLEETFGAKKTKDFKLNDLDWADPDAIMGFKDDLLSGYIYGYASMPIGVQVDLSMMGITDTAALQTRLVTGNDVANPDKGKYDLSAAEDGDDPTDSGADAYNPLLGGDPDLYEPGSPRAYATPMYASVDVAYEMDMSGMTIAPSADFQLSTDFFKFAENGDDDGFEYTGDVKAAQFLTADVRQRGRRCRRNCRHDRRISLRCPGLRFWRCRLRLAV